MSEGEFKKRVYELWKNVETPNTYQSPTDVHAQKRVLLGETELMLDEAHKEFQEWWDLEPELVEPQWYDMCGENLPDSERYYIDRDEFEEAYKDWIDKGRDLFLKWFGDGKK